MAKFSDITVGKIDASKITAEKITEEDCKKLSTIWIGPGEQPADFNITGIEGEETPRGWPYKIYKKLQQTLQQFYNKNMQS